MEVPHHSSANKKTKSLKEYLFDFFMLFLAISAGFYADNLREKFVDKTKEHEYMESLVADLQQDSEHLSSAIAQLKSYTPGLDSLAAACYYKEINDSIQYVLYDLNLRFLRLIPLTFSDRASTQLKNSGSLRLIRNKAVTDSLLNYWQQIDYFNYVSPPNENFRRKARELSFKIFDYGEYNSDIGFSRNNVRHPHPKLLTLDRALMSEYVNYIWGYRATLSIFYFPSVVKLKTQAQNLLTLIKKEYRIENVEEKRIASAGR